YAMFEAFDRGYSVDEVADLTGIKSWYVERYEHIAEAAGKAADGEFEPAAAVGFTDQEVAAMAAGDDAMTRADGSGAVTVDDATVDEVGANAPDRDFKQVDTCAGEFAASTPYYYSAREPEFGGDTALATDEVRVDRDVES